MDHGGGGVKDTCDQRFECGSKSSHKFLHGSDPVAWYFMAFISFKSVTFKSQLLGSLNRFKKVNEREECSDITPLTSRKVSIGKVYLNWTLWSYFWIIDRTSWYYHLWATPWSCSTTDCLWAIGLLFWGSALSIANTLRMQVTEGHVYSIRAWNKNFGMYRQMSIKNHEFCAAIAYKQFSCS